MVRKVQVVLQDDIDGSEAAQTVHFSLEGRDYEIDLNDEHAAELRACLAPWIAAGRRASTGLVPEPRSKPRGPVKSADIRRWAEENSIPVAARGRLPVDIRTRYEAAH